MSSSVLLVDDNEDLLECIGSFLKIGGFNVRTAQNGSQACIEYQNARPDLVIMDIVMGGMDGYDTFFQIKDADPDAKVILMTGFQKKERFYEAEKRGLFGFIEKPFTGKQLLDYLSEKNVLPTAAM